MTLDVPTLMLAGAFVALLAGAMLVFAWHQYRELSAVLWWAGGNFLMAFGVACLAIGGVNGSDAVVGLGFALLAASPALIWTSARLLNGLPARHALAFIGPAIALSVNALPPTMPVADIRGAVSTFVGVAYYLATAWTLIFRTRDAFRSRWPLSGFILVHAGLLVVGAFTAAGSGGAANALPPLASVFGMIHFEALIFLIGTTIFVVAHMREASELHFKATAATDPLTGLANRRDLFERAEGLLERARREEVELAVVVMDLDRFKLINDSFGHAVGDEVLKVFAGVARRALRPNDILGRLGGEEFAVILPGTDADAARAIAERIRRTYREVAETVAGQTVNGTVSAGIATREPGDGGISDLLRRGDEALYRAKRLGRNRVEAGDRGEHEGAGARIVRIA